MDSANFENETKPFKLRAELSFTLCKRPNGVNLFYWNEPFGSEANSVWEFIFTEKGTTMTTVEMFQMTVAQCIFENEMKKSLNSATDQEIKRYILTDTEAIENFNFNNNISIENNNNSSSISKEG